MARAYQVTNKSGNLAEADLKNDGSLKNFGLLKVGTDGKINAGDVALGTFLMNPATYEENKSSNWAPQNVPGQSDPIYQWVSGGPRVVTFEALVTRDSIHLGGSSGGLLDNLAGAALSVVGDIASNFAGVSLPPAASLFPGPDPNSGTTLSVADKLNYYRSLLYAKYTEAFSGLSASPPLVVMFSGNSFRGNLEAGTGNSDPNGDYFPVWFVQNLNIKITKQLPNLDPMEARVTFTLHEYPVKPISIGNFLPTPPAPAGSNSLLGNVGKAFGGLF
jgi:hypothetical protein